MTRILVALALTVMAAPVLRVQDPPAADRLIDIDVVAVDRDGMPVTDLKAADLDVWIGGYRAPIDSLLAVVPGDAGAERSVVLVLDDIVVPHEVTPVVRQVARRFVTTKSADDEMAIVSLAGDTIKLTADPVPLLKRADAYNVRTTGILRPEDLGAQVLGTFASVARSLAEAPGRRRTIVAIGAGWLFDRPMPPPSIGRDLQQEWVDAMRALASTRTSVYVIDVGGVGRSPVTGGDSGFARETGGHAFTNTNDFDGAVARILAEASTYYLVRVTNPPAHRKAPLREVDVRATRRGITVRARRGIPGAQ
jgi:VWFA-related protein